MSGTPTPAPESVELKLSTSAPLLPAQPVDLVLELRDRSGQRITKLEVAHEKLLHLIVVSDDLSFFGHEHPAQEPDGRLRLASFQLPRPGTYVLFADHKPTGGKPQVTRATLDVAGVAPSAVPLAPVQPPHTATVGKFAVTLTTSVPPVAGGDVVLQFDIAEGGAPVTDLRNYLGARGHCVGIRESADEYLHSHPLGGTNGSRVDFHTVFPVAGKYRVWAEFRPHGEKLLADFVIEVLAAGATGSGAGHGNHEHH